MVDSALSSLEHITDAVKGHCVELLDEYELRSLLDDIMSDVECWSDEASADLEKVRRNAEDLRSWGEEFQRISDETLEELQPLQHFEEQMSTWRGTFHHIFDMSRHQLRCKIKSTLRPTRQTQPII